jgi:molecular chaperone HtpG
MAPSTGSQMTLMELLENHVEALQRSADVEDPSYFEVALEGFVNPPIECINPQSMRSFISQVAPVPYTSSFPWRTELEREAAKRFGGIETVRVMVVSNDTTVEVFKEYGSQVSVGKSDVDLTEHQIFQSPSGKWWGWVGFKAFPGAIRDESVKGIRIRVRNIQIDGTQIFGRLFDQIPNAKSYRRFNDWYVGEIFVDPTALVPNARRDGFEDEQKWRDVQRELVDVCKVLGQNAYKISTTNQASLKVLAGDVRDLETDAKALLSAGQSNGDKIMALSTRVNKLHRNVTRAFKTADFELSGQLRSLENKLLDVKTRAVRKLGVTQMLDAEEIREAAQRELVTALMSAFKDQLEMKCYREVRKVIKSVVGYE